MSAIGSIGVFALHTGLRLPNGILEGALATLYVGTVISGLVGLYLTRTIPAQLARVGEEVLYERIPALNRQVQRQAGDLVLLLGQFFRRDNAGRFLCGPTVCVFSSVARHVVFSAANDRAAPRR